MVALTEGQWELRADTDEALVVGPSTSYRWPRDWVQWWGAPSVSVNDLPRSRANGTVAGVDVIEKHSTTIIVKLLGDDADDLRDKIDAWKAATAVLAEGLVTVRACIFGETRRRYGRFRIPGEVTALGRTTLGGHVADASCLFEALDGLTYSDDEHTESTGRVESGDGFDVPFTVPFSLGASVGGTLSALNAGNDDAPWTATLTGPLEFPTITHVTSGRRLSLAFEANGGVDLGAGDVLVLDSAARTVLLNGLTDRRTQLTIDSTWWDLAPGQNDFQLDADSGAGLLTVAWRDGYHS